MISQTLEEIKKWVDSSTAYLSTSTEYARGYKDGIEQAKAIVQNILDTTTQKNDMVNPQNQEPQ
jgi:formyltetrahydrofolate synthetase